MVGDTHRDWKLPISFYLTLITICFSVSGYVYARTYYQLFGIDVEKFFTLEDYIRNSIDQIYNAALAVGWSFIIWLLFEKILEKPNIIKDAQGNNKKDSVRKKKLWIMLLNVLLLFSALIVCVLIIVFTFAVIDFNKYLFYMMLLGIVTVLVYKLVKKTGFGGLDKVEWFLLSSMVAFLILVFLGAHHNAYLIKEGKKSESSLYEFKFGEINKMKHIGSTSQFLFMYDEHKKYTMIVPVSDLKSVKVNE